jgi:hypothetical protein
VVSWERSQRSLTACYQTERATKTGVLLWVSKVLAQSAEIIEFRPELYGFFAHFPRDPKNARALGDLIAFGDRGGAVVRMGFAATALAACARTGVGVSRVTRVSGLGKPRVSAFYKGYKSMRG